MSSDDYKNRVVDEKIELAKKYQKLSRFMFSSAYEGLDISEQDRLKIQLEIMDKYLDILDERIKNF